MLCAVLAKAVTSIAHSLASAASSSSSSFCSQPVLQPLEDFSDSDIHNFPSTMRLIHEKSFQFGEACCNRLRNSTMWLMDLQKDEPK